MVYFRVSCVEEKLRLAATTLNLVIKVLISAYSEVERKISFGKSVRYYKAITQLILLLYTIYY